MIKNMGYVEEARALKHREPSVTLDQHRRARYVSPDAVYEGALLRLVQPNTRWLDAGCGASPCPHNPALAAYLAAHCALLAGADPGPNLVRNPYLHVAMPSPVEASHGGPYDLITLRMVAEHVSDPAHVAAALRRLLAPDGTLLVYTVHAHSPTVMAGRLLPEAGHRLAMRALCGGQNRDVFRTHYLMNTQLQLGQIMHGFVLRRWTILDDCRLTLRWPWLHALELRIWNAFRRLGVTYPERCILAEYKVG